MPGDTGYVTVNIPDITPYMPMANIVIRLNDDGTTFPWQAECYSLNNVITIPNPALHLIMKKNATLLSVQHRGSLANPVAVFHDEIIAYRITAVNAHTSPQKITIIDTIPPWLNYLSSTPSVTQDTITTGYPQQTVLKWVFPNVPATRDTTVTFFATPEAGVSASQPLFINRAWVILNDTDTIPTNYTYHQGAGVSLVTFSAGFGGRIYNATEQALDYGTSPRSGIVVVPDEGYRFAGWQHNDYLSLRGVTIREQSGIMHYDTLTVYGNVALKAEFEPEVYTIEYYLHDSENVADNPLTYTICTETITLGAPEKSGDVFVGWTGSNGDEPQPAVTIPRGSTGERVYYANYLYSGRGMVDPESENIEDNRIWAAGNMLYVRTSLSGNILRVYSPEGILLKQQTLLQSGLTTIQLPRGLYVVTLNNGIGQMVRIE